MPSPVSVPVVAQDAYVNIALDTIARGKQALVFVGTKRSAEAAAETIAKKIKEDKDAWAALAEGAKGVLGKPTHQCERLATALKKGIAFHHAGLHGRQREIVEDAFRSGDVRIICCTPTLAAGVDLPAFRAVIRDVKRFSGSGSDYIPVLEYLQMAGRAGRPRFDTFGEAVLVAQTETERDVLTDKYLRGQPEAIYSKLAVEPVLRTYLLSLIASRIIGTRESISEFFSRTFWAHQYRDMTRLERTLDRMLALLEEWEFLQKSGDRFAATPVGERVAQLYLDPLTAHELMVGLQQATSVALKPMSFLHLVANTLEMRPQLRVKAKEYDRIMEAVGTWSVCLLSREPSMFDAEYEDWLNAIKTSLMFHDWMDEKDEEWILEQYDCRPGETRAKLDIADWLLYSCTELAKLMKLSAINKEVTRARMRLRYGVKEELLPLLRLEGVGRVRARRLFNAGFKDLGDLKKADEEVLGRLIGKAIAASIKRQLGQEALEPVSERKRKGQMGLRKYDE